jgi:hypothetical protein
MVLRAERVVVRRTSDALQRDRFRARRGRNNLNSVISDAVVFARFDTPRCHDHVERSIFPVGEEVGDELETVTFDVEGLFCPHPIAHMSNCEVFAIGATYSRVVMESPRSQSLHS